MHNHSPLRDHVLNLRRDAIHRGGAVFVRPVPLFVLLAHNMHDDAIFECIDYAIDDGYGDPDDIDPSDERQTSRLETAIIENANEFGTEELLTIEIVGWPGGLQYSLCTAMIDDDCVLVVHRSHDIPSFQAVAIGEVGDLLLAIRDAPDVLLPRLHLEDDKIAVVVIRQQLDLSCENVSGVVRALTGISVSEDYFVRTDLLVGASP